MTLAAVDDRSDLAELSGGRTEHHRAGAVAEQRRRPLVRPVNDPRREVGADQQHMLRPPGLDLGSAERHSGQEAGAGRAQVDYHLMRTDEPVDRALGIYLMKRLSRRS